MLANMERGSTSLSWA